MTMCVIGHVQKNSMSVIHRVAGKDTPAIESKIKSLNHRLLKQEDTLNFAFSNISHATGIRIKYLWVSVFVWGPRTYISHFPVVIHYAQEVKEFLILFNTLRIRMKT